MTDLPCAFEDATALIEAVIADRGLLAPLTSEQRKRFLMAAGQVVMPDKAAKKQLKKAQRRKDKVTKRDTDRNALAHTGIRKLRENPIFETPKRLGIAPKDTAPIGQTGEERVCYVCRARFQDVHHFYDQMCLSCGDENFAKRVQTADLTGRVALVTGSRVKIGYQAAILLLRSGAHVICTTRFPVDAASRYAREDDFDEWKDRLEIPGIDLRHTPSVEALCSDLLERHDRLDVIINNACQTVRRPPAFYEHMMAGELEASADSPGRALVASSRAAAMTAAQLSQVALLPEDRVDPTALFPADKLDADLQQVDLRDVNSWRLKMHEVPAVELLEVHLVNAVAPFILNARLKPLMAKVETNDAHIINVSAMEGQFYRTFKSDRHPHTNMAKASLNMMTRTSGQDYVEHGIHMNSVDTGWVTDEDPAVHAESKKAMHDFHPPLDIVDGAARIVDPFMEGQRSGKHVWGQFLKDYRITDW
jgi:NAD(P)-dependent dehydrogenase (short-subunit alcohol dehydrogenase family)